LKSWSLLPGWGFALATRLEEKLLPGFGCFVDIELVKGLLSCDKSGESGLPSR
jgi:hypothetical protein